MNKQKWWAISNATACAFLFLIGIMWAYTTIRYKPNDEQLTTLQAVDDYLDRQSPNQSRRRIPTGVFLQSLSFNSASEVNITGYIWQTYNLTDVLSKTVGENVSTADLVTQFEQLEDDALATLLEQAHLGFTLPEAVDSGSHNPPKIVYRTIKNSDQVVVGWYTEATLKQKFNYDKYPFDHKTVWIRLWSKDFEAQTQLTPDLGAYPATGPKDQFGYDQDIVLGQWTIKETFFDYDTKSYNSDFGLGLDYNASPHPELYFNVVIKRRFLNSFVVFILPILVISGLTYATLLMITKDPERSAVLGMNTSGVIGVCSGLFFVVLVSQVQIREQFAGSKIVYVEYFYPLMYLSLLGVSVNSYLFSLPNKGKHPILTWLDAKDNLYPKLLYWPVLLGSAAVITAGVLLPDKGKGTEDKQPRTFLDGNRTTLIDQTPYLKSSIHSMETERRSNYPQSIARFDATAFNFFAQELTIPSGYDNGGIDFERL
ncbi:hypothetical protein U2F10_35410 [Leptothoe sp. EHU-05/26/07-4]